MSFWAAMVITSLFYSIPFIGTDLIYLIWVEIVDSLDQCRETRLRTIDPLVCTPLDG